MTASHHLRPVTRIDKRENRLRDPFSGSKSILGPPGVIPSWTGVVVKKPVLEGLRICTILVVLLLFLCIEHFVRQMFQSQLCTCLQP